jgi:hypothetical protein
MLIVLLVGSWAKKRAVPLEPTSLRFLTPAGLAESVLPKIFLVPAGVPSVTNKSKLVVFLVSDDALKYALPNA